MFNLLNALLDRFALRRANRALDRLRRLRPEDDPYHKLYARFIELVGNAESPSILEVGSRNVSGLTRRRHFPNAAHYVGMDIHPGDGVDVVADAHELSAHFPEQSFDFVFSISVFEHLMFPWKVALEINTVLKPGGYLFLATHPAWPSHELPWDFWRFLHHSSTCMFNDVTGFEVIEVSEGNPARLFSLSKDIPTRDLYMFPINLGIAIIARKTASYDRDRLKWNVTPVQVANTSYPVRP